MNEDNAFDEWTDTSKYTFIISAQALNTFHIPQGIQSQHDIHKYNKTTIPIARIDNIYTFLHITYNKSKFC